MGRAVTAASAGGGEVAMAVLEGKEAAPEWVVDACEKHAAAMWDDFYRMATSSHRNDIPSLCLLPCCAVPTLSCLGAARGGRRGRVPLAAWPRPSAQSSRQIS